jgi:hypothetical protein
MSEDVERPDSQETQKSDAAEYVHSLGRDGSYVELDVMEAAEFLFWVLEDKKPWPRQMVIKASRLDVTDPKIMADFKAAFEAFVKSDEVRGLDYGQMGFLFFKKVFDTGLRGMTPTTIGPIVKYGA